MEEETVTISKKEYDELVDAAMWADALDAAGVDCWDGYDFAQERYADFKKELLD